MASLLVFASDHAKNKDPAIDASSVPKRGHVIDVSDNDDQHWGNEIHKPDGLGWWRVIVIPGEPASKYRHLCDGDAALAADGVRQQYPRYRINRLDLDAIEGAAETDDQHVIRLSKGADILKQVSVVAVVPVGVVIGSDPLVIG